ncbi:MAG: hypothetical protein RIQ94_1542 [Pseudomonadota bacterium]|jgi:hypothetical protein
MSQIDQTQIGIFYSLIQKHPEVVGNFEKIANLATDMSRMDQFFNLVKPVTTNHELIRIGGESDGGYLIPNDLEGIEMCFSPGVSSTADFEFELANRGIKSYLADYSVDAPPFENRLFHFEKKYLGDINDSVYMTLESWVNRNAPDQNELILQMDIEGSEYPVICSTNSEILRKFRIIVIELHDLYRLCDKQGFETINLTFEKLLNDFDIVHIHPNNNCFKINYGRYEIPSLLEFTFLRKDRILNKQPATSFPHELDRQNVVGDDFPLPVCWYLRSD